MTPEALFTTLKREKSLLFSWKEFKETATAYILEDAVNLQIDLRITKRANGVLFEWMDY